MSPPRSRLTWIYMAAVIIPAAVAAAVLAAVGAAEASASDAQAAAHAGDLGRVLATIVIVVAAAHAGGALAVRLHQPCVIGQAAVGLMLGPSLLGVLAPGAADFLRHPASVRAVDLLAQLGVILFVFVVSQQMAGHSAAGSVSQAVAIGHAMIAVPFVCGVLTAVLLLEPYRPPAVGGLPYALFLGAALSATALPVLAHILAERRMLTSKVGTLATGSAAVGDATLWCLLAVTMCLVERGSLAQTMTRLAGAAVFAAAVWWLARPLMAYAAGRYAGGGILGPAALLAGLLLSAAATEHLGLHAIFGAFLFGLAVPRGAIAVQQVTTMASGLTEWLLLPLFFTAVGLRTDLGLLSGNAAISLCAAVLAVAALSKLISGTAVSRAVGLSWRESAAIGVAMNCRGMTELLVLNTGLAAGVIGSDVFAVFVVMTLVTTAATGPLLTLLGYRRPTRPSAAAQPPVPVTAAVPS
ncbi:hypothetical protein GCM10009661_50110 [Catellatospora chokoriensis]|uniref:Cation/H+ exchanger transmembrane domain-containing protein n=2 Tax=Catellatospora chokoriensis TaxID=310353 RepID=A0A8J3NVE3_9ACTN|nr:hypothetical protein Cch02nite_73410 [Catellatospora chokoriensis]